METVFRIERESETLVYKNRRSKRRIHSAQCQPAASLLHLIFVYVCRIHLIPMANTVPSSSSSSASASASASLSAINAYHVFISHRGIDTKKSLASHLYQSLILHGLRAFLDKRELQLGYNFPSQITDAITNASVHVAVFSPGYADSDWCLKELVYMLDSRAPIIPVFYNVQPNELRWTHSKGLYAEALRKHEEKMRHDPATIKSWREALSSVSQISGLDLQENCNGDEGELVEKIVKRVLDMVRGMPVRISGFYCSQHYGSPGGSDWSDGTYSGIRRIIMTEKHNTLTSVQLAYGLEGDETLKDLSIFGLLHGLEDGASIEYNLNFPEEIVTKISGYFGSYDSWDVIKSLSFHTNQRKLGPCGQEQGIAFETEERGKIVGIFGSGGALVESIGVYTLQPRTSTYEEFYRSQLYGGTGGNYWNDGTYSGIRRITMTERDNWLTSVQLHYGLEGAESVKDKYIRGPRHGVAGGIRREYTFNYPEEFVTKISGYFETHGTGDVIISLTFHSNQGKYGPCGKEGGRYFETEVGGKIVGLFGSSGDLVDSIGVYMLKQRTSDDKEFRRSQIYGGTGGKFWNDGTYSGIRRITMTTHHNNWLNSVQLHYGLEGDESLKDKSFLGLRHGVAGGAQKEYNLNYPEEFVTKISGHLGKYGPQDVIISLTFHTNQGKHGPCGLEGGRYFETEEAGGKIVGIFGSSGDFLDSIGVYTVKPRKSKDEEFYRSQPYGGHERGFWNDGTYSGIRRIAMTVRDNWLTSVQLHYGLEGDESVKDLHICGLRHGCGDGAPVEYNLNYPEEFVTKISGHIGRYGPWDVIISLTFHTNQGKHGPCGYEGGPYFETEEGGKIVGLFGSSGDLVDLIGVYMLKPRTLKDEPSESDCENKHHQEL